MKKEIAKLPFDQYQRHRLVAETLASVRPEGRKLRVLDVGGRTGLLRRFLPDDVVIVADRRPSRAAEGAVLADGCRLPFRDGSFDAVCALDTLEHIRSQRRRSFVRECWRVSGGLLLLTGPFGSPRTRSAESILRGFLVRKIGTENPHLREHKDYGLPDRQRLEAHLRKLGGRVASIGHGNVDLWLVLMAVSLYLDADAAMRSLAGSIHAFYNERLFRRDRVGPFYRHLIVAAKEGAKLPDLQALMPPEREGEEATSRELTELALELCAFDRERVRWTEVRQELERSIATLRMDLAGHRSSLRELEPEVGHLRESRSELLRERNDQRKVIADLTRDLEGHRAALSKTTSELQGQGAQWGKLEREVANLRKVRDELLVERGDQQMRIAELEGQVHQQRRGIKKLHRELEEQRENAKRLAALNAHNEELLRLARERAGGDRKGVARIGSLLGLSRGKQAQEMQSAFDEQEAQANELRTQLAAVSGERDALKRDVGAAEARIADLEKRVWWLDNALLEAVEMAERRRRAAS